MPKIQWYAASDSEDLGQERQQLLRLAVLPQRAATLSKYIAPDASVWGVHVHPRLNLTVGFTHWSRVWEYPWVIRNGNFKPKHKVFDAGGSSSILPYRLMELCQSVVICDLDVDAWHRFSQTPTHQLWGERLAFIQCDICTVPYPDNYFDRVVCVSVLEHCTHPLQAVAEMLRILTPGGRLVLTMDVADRVRHNHTIDLSVATDIANHLGMILPPLPDNVKQASFDESKPIAADEPDKTTISVLGMVYDKPLS